MPSLLNRRYKPTTQKISGCYFILRLLYSKLAISSLARSIDSKRTHVAGHEEAPTESDTIGSITSVTPEATALN